jgi:serine/threonine protein kinase
VKPVTFQPGQQVCGERGGTFRVLEWAGEGSYARVYRAQGAHDLVALKLAKQEVSGAMERLLQEKAAHAVLRHPAIPEFVDADLSGAAGGPGGAVWLARQWVEGTTLTHRLATGRGLPLVQAVPLLHRVADAVAAIHQAGWFHGDLRPHNVMLEAGTTLAFVPDLGDAHPFRGSVTDGHHAGRAVRRSLANVIRPRTAASPVAEPPSIAAGPLPPTGLRSAVCDLQQLGDLLAWTLTGENPHVHPDRLSAAAGYHPAVVRLWQETRSGQLSSAVAFRESLERLARQLGLSLPRRQG